MCVALCTCPRGLATKCEHCPCGANPYSWLRHERFWEYKRQGGETEMPPWVSHFVDPEAFHDWMCLAIAQEKAFREWADWWEGWDPDRDDRDSCECRQ